MKKILPAAVIAASLGGVNVAQALHVNPEGKGQVLLYPFYSAEADNDTLINLVNTTNDFKAVKIRILESMNSQEVLDFNIYMSPWDHWSAVITADANGEGATLTSNDNTCTVPTAVSAGATIPFRTFEFDGSRAGSVADSESGADRTKEGYVEVIEMGTITDASLTDAIKHGNDGIPGSGTPDSLGCDLMNEYWSGPSGIWLSDSDFGMSTVSGGLYGYGVLIDVPAGAAGAYDAVAIDNWSVPGAIVHTAPGSTFPSLGSNADLFYDVFTGDPIRPVIQGEASNGWDSVSAVLMTADISNDYVLEPTVAAGTDWVVTFPTKRNYVNGEDAPERPFTDAWDPNTSTACEVFDIDYWDREEKTTQTPIDPTDFSPLPPEGIPQTFAFCHEANVLTFNESNVLDASDRTGVNLNLEDGFDNGWARIDFAFGEGRVLNTGDDLFFGLPAIGFAVQRYVNGDLDVDICDGDDACVEPLVESVRANYGGTVQHKGNVQAAED